MSLNPRRSNTVWYLIQGGKIYTNYIDTFQSSFIDKAFHWFQQTIMFMALWKSNETVSLVSSIFKIYTMSFLEELKYFNKNENYIMYEIGFLLILLFDNLELSKHRYLVKLPSRLYLPPGDKMKTKPFFMFWQVWSEPCD